MARLALRIGVLTLRLGDEAQLDPGPLGGQVKALIGQGTLRYASAPDDWIPFNDGTTILRHLKEGLDAFDLFSDSASLGDFRTRLGIKLFVIDPAVLLHRAKANLATLIQEHVCSRSDKASCIVISRTLPAQFFADLRTYYLDKFSDFISHDGSLFEYQVDDLLRLKQFLKQVTPLLGDVPVSQQFAKALQILADINGSIVQPIGTPAIGIGAGG